VEDRIPVAQGLQEIPFPYVLDGAGQQGPAQAGAITRTRMVVARAPGRAGRALPRRHACPHHSPDPRWFALHKLWLGAQAKRNPAKRWKGVAQGNALLDAVAEAMPHYDLGSDIAADLPVELTPYFEGWRTTHQA
jgi:hypothetical protein